jgi:hypothetical protein
MEGRGFHFTEAYEGYVVQPSKGEFHLSCVVRHEGTNLQISACMITLAKLIKRSCCNLHFYCRFGIQKKIATPSHGIGAVSPLDLETTWPKAATLFVSHLFLRFLPITSLQARDNPH